jgi:insertion element IS1 protein InsB
VRAYYDLLPASLHQAGKDQTQSIERKHLDLRTRIKRLARRTICFSKSELMHDTVIGLLINQVFFNLNIHSQDTTTNL